MGERVTTHEEEVAVHRCAETSLVLLGRDDRGSSRPGGTACVLVRKDQWLERWTGEVETYRRGTHCP